MKYRYKIIVCLLTVLISHNYAKSQSGEYFIKVEGEVTTPLKLVKEDLIGMKRTDLTFKDFSGIEYQYKGVSLLEILKCAGAVTGPIQGEDLAKYVLIKSSDGSEVVFSFAELDPIITGQTIILADQMNGKPLAHGTGPFRIIVPNEKERTRWIWEVNLSGSGSPEST